MFQCLNDLSDKHFYLQEILTDVLLGSNSKQVILDKLSKQPLFARFNTLSYQ